MLRNLLMYTFRGFLLELPVAAVNYFLLMKRVYEPRVGELRAHQIGMATRIGYLFGAAYLVLWFARDYTTSDLVVAGAFWTALVLVFEWGGSVLLRRPVQEILVGWHVNRGYLWPFVLLTYLLSLLVVGTTLHPSR